MSQSTALEAPRKSQGTMLRVGAVLLSALQAGEAARFASAGRLLPALLVGLCVVAGVMTGMFSLMRYGSASRAHGPHGDGQRHVRHGVDLMVGAAFGCFFLSEAIADGCQPGGLRVVGFVIGALGTVGVVGIAARELWRRHREAE